MIKKSCDDDCQRLIMYIGNDADKHQAHWLIRFDSINHGSRHHIVLWHGNSNTFSYVPRLHHRPAHRKSSVIIIFAACISIDVKTGSIHAQCSWITRQNCDYFVAISVQLIWYFMNLFKCRMDHWTKFFKLNVSLLHLFRGGGDEWWLQSLWIESNALQLRDYTTQCVIGFCRKKMFIRGESHVNNLVSESIAPL